MNYSGAADLFQIGLKPPIPRIAPPINRRNAQAIAVSFSRAAEGWLGLAQAPAMSADMARITAQL
jgi:hypothetical protein